MFLTLYTLHFQVLRSRFLQCISRFLLCALCWQTFFFLKIDAHLGAAEILPMGWNVGAHCRHVRGISRDSLGSGIAPGRAIERALASLIMWCYFLDTIARECYVVLIPNYLCYSPGMYIFVLYSTKLCYLCIVFLTHITALSRSERIYMKGHFSDSKSRAFPR